MPVLTSEQRRSYEVDGLLVVPGLLDSTTLSPLYDAIEELVGAGNDRESPVVEFEDKTTDGALVPRRIFHPFEKHSVFRELAVSPTVIEPVKELLGPDLALQHSKLNMKPARVGSAVEWHQDMTYFPHTNTSLVAVLIYLDDVTIDNGCLQALPGRHHKYFDHSLPDRSFAGMITEEIGGAPVTLAGSAGTAVFMHPLTPHRSLVNTSESSRRLLIYQYRAADAFPIYNGTQVTSCEQHAHHLTGQVARFARFGGPSPGIYFPVNAARSIFELQASSRTKLIDGA